MNFIYYLIVVIELPNPSKHKPIDNEIQNNKNDSKNNSNQNAVFPSFLIKHREILT